MIELLLAFAAFIVSHVAIVRTRIRPWLIERIGKRNYLIAYSVLSLVLLGWVITALLTSPRVQLWSTPAWAYPFAIVVSAIGFALIGAGSAIVNPLSVSFRREGFDPARPGLVGWIRHPLIWGFGLWGLAHIPANGDWPSLVLFGGTVVFALVGTRAVDRRMQKRLGEARWHTSTGSGGNLDGTAIAGAVAGVVAWVLALATHVELFGVNPWVAAHAVVFGG